MSFMNSSALDDLARRLADAIPPSIRNLGQDLESNFKAVLQAQLAKLDLVSRAEFDVQTALLGRTQERRLNTAVAGRGGWQKLVPHEALASP
jgi:BMFP domain-containing protein YqiC